MATGHCRGWCNAAVPVDRLSVVAIGTTSLPIRLVIGIGAPGVVTVFFGGSRIAQGDRRNALGIFIGLAVATPITLFLWWVMVISSGTL